MNRHLALLILPILLALWACGGEQLTSAEGQLELSPTEIDFGGVLLKRNERRELQVRNVGNAPATLSFLEAPAGFRVEPAELSVASGTLASVEVIFSPEVDQAYEGTIRFAGPSEAPLEVAVRGDGTERALDTEKVLDFGVVRLGEVKTLPLDVASLTDIDLDVDAVYTGSEAQAFRSSAGRMQLPPRGTGRLFVEFSPIIRGPHAARLRLQPCPSCAEVTVQLKGEGAGESASVQPSPLDFGVLSPGDSIRREVRVTSRGDVGTWVLDAELLHQRGAPLRLVQQPWPVAVEGGSTVLYLDFAPDRAGSWEATLRLVVAGEPVEIPVFARAQAPVLEVEPGEVDFGVVPVGTRHTLPLRLRNTADEPIFLSELVIEGALTQPFSIEPALQPPIELGDEPLDLEVKYNATVVGEAAGELIVQVDDRPESSVRVPLLGRTASEESRCELVLPEAVRFGLVPVGEVERRTVEVRNLAAGECWLWNFESTGSSAFRWTGLPEEGPAVVASGEALALEVEYAPLAPAPGGEEIALHFRALGNGAPRHVVAAGGASAAIAVELSPASLDFGIVESGSVELRSVSLRNLGRLPLTLGRAEVAGAGDEVELAGGTQLPHAIGKGEQAAVHVAYRPDASSSLAGELRLHLPGVVEPLLVPLQGAGTEEVCEDCGGPVVACPETAQVRLPGEVVLAGSAEAMADGPIGCSWSVLGGPAGSTAQLDQAGTQPCAATFHPGQPGSYLLEMYASTPSGTASCQTTVDALAAPGLAVEAGWTSSVDLDLLLLHPAAGSPGDAASWSDPQAVCSYANPSPSWDGAGTEDDPLLEKDARRAPGLERIRIEAPVIGQAYEVGLHFFATMQGQLPAEGSITVHCGGGVAAQVSRTLPQLHDLAHMGTITWQADGSCSFVPASGIVSVVP